MEDSTLLLFKPWLLGYCNCGCGKEVGYSKNKLNKYIYNHNPKGLDSFNWKYGRFKRKRTGYWWITIPGNGTILEHVYNFQEYHKCCMLPWGVVHHKDGNKDNNMPEWNLQGMMERDHLSIHHSGQQYRVGRNIDTSDRRCYICTSENTLISKTRTPYPKWCHLPWDKEHWYCSRCYDRERRGKDKAFTEQ